MYFLSIYSAVLLNLFFLYGGYPLISSLKSSVFFCIINFLPRAALAWPRDPPLFERAAWAVETIKRQFDIAFYILHNIGNYILLSNRKNTIVYSFSCGLLIPWNCANLWVTLRGLLQLHPSIDRILYGKWIFTYQITQIIIKSFPKLYSIDCWKQNRENIILVLIAYNLFRLSVRI